MYSIYGNIYHQYTPNVSIYTIHGSYGNSHFQLALFSWHGGTLKNLPGASHNFGRSLGTRAMLEMAPRVTAVHVWLIGAVHVWRIWMDLRFHPRGLIMLSHHQSDDIWDFAAKWFSQSRARLSVSRKMIPRVLRERQLPCSPSCSHRVSGCFRETQQHLPPHIYDDLWPTKKSTQTVVPVDDYLISCPYPCVIPG